MFWFDDVLVPHWFDAADTDRRSDSVGSGQVM
jgi:hypothetical protein